MHKKNDGAFDNAPPNMPHPYKDGVIFCGILTGAFALSAMIFLVLMFSDLMDDLVWFILASFMAGFWLLVLTIVWVLGVSKLGRIKGFINSDRPLVRWRYTTTEWQAIKEREWEEMKEVIRVAPGYLAAIFAASGVVFGLIVGLDKGFEAWIKFTLFAVLGGAISGGLLGGLLSLGNYLGSRWSRNKDRQALVALGVDEVFHVREYFRSNGLTKYIMRVSLDEAAQPPKLTLVLYDPKPKQSHSKQTWSLVVPARMVEQVKATLPAIRTGEWRRGRP
jgi:hypothetical protein